MPQASVVGHLDRAGTLAGHPGQMRDAVFAGRFGIPVEAGWSGFPEALPILLEAAKTGSVTEWGPHPFFDDDDALVGNRGWKGP